MRHTTLVPLAAAAAALALLAGCSDEPATAIGAAATTAGAAWSLNGQVVTVYVSAPHGSERAARILYGQATDLRIYTHLGPEAG